MRKIKAWLFLGSFLISAPSRAFDLGLVGAFNVASPRIAGTQFTSDVFSSAASFGFGALVRFGASPTIGFEAGGLYIPRQFNTANSGITGNETLTMLEFPVVLRFTIPFVSFGVGGYYAYGVGISTTTNGVANSGQTYSGLSTSQSDYGLTGSIALDIPILPSLSVLVDARALYGLANLSTQSGSDPANSLTLWDFQVLAGILIGL